jgi:hypothetical protein
MENNCHITRTHLEQRVNSLGIMKLNELKRLEKLRSEVKIAEENLIRIDAAAQDCDFWMGELTRLEASYLPPLANRDDPSFAGGRVPCQSRLSLEDGPPPGRVDSTPQS